MPDDTPTPAEPTTTVDADSGLVRGIRRWDLVALVINGVIGAGIFGLPSKVYDLIGAYSLLAFVACAAVVVLIVLCFAEVTSRFTGTGGPYLFARAAFGPIVGFQIGWLLWLTRLTAFAAICNLFVEYFSYFWPAASTEPWRAATISTVVALLAIINVVGVRASAVASNIFTVGKLTPLLLFIGIGAFFVEGDHFSFAERPSYPDFSKAVLMLIYAFTGFEIPIIAAGEVREPRSNFPFALLLGIGVVVVLYVSIQFVCIGTLPNLGSSARPLADASQRILGPVAAAVIALGALISMTGTMNATLLAASRLPFAMAQQGQLPRWLAATQLRFRTPYASILLSSLLILAISLSGSFVYALTISAISRLFTYAATCAALPVLRARGDRFPAAFLAPGGVVLAIASLALIGWLLSNTGLTDARDVGIAIALGLVLCLAYRKLGTPEAD